MHNRFKKAILFICLQIVIFSFISSDKLFAENPYLEELIIPNPPYNPGMFSVFCSVLGILASYDANQPLYNGIDVCLQSGLYLDPSIGSNWWEYFFEPISIYKNPTFIPRIITMDELAHFGWWPIYNLSRQRGFELINKYVKVKKNIQNKIDAYVETHFSDHYIIGIHYRGTDKISEARRIPYEEVLQNVQHVIHHLPLKKKNNYALFVATDEQGFLEFMQSNFSCPIFYTDSIRSTTGYPTHYHSYENNNYQKGEDALLDCLLLSKGNFLIRTVSNLSFISERFNPLMPVIILQ